MKIIDFPQGSPEWLQARVGLVTASRIADVIAKTKTGPSASRAGYLGELVAERLTGQSAESGYTNADMQRGTELEPDARFAYELQTNQIVETCGLVLHPTLQAGASPDGLVGADGLLEIKCPRTHVHIDYIEGGKPPAKYIPQMAWQCICTGRAWCDFASYDPRLPESMRLIVIRLHRDDAMIAELEAEVAKFLAEVDATVAALRNQYEPQKEAA